MIGEGIPRPVSQGGDLAYFGLDEWWMTVLAEEDRRRITEVFKPLNMGGSRGESLTRGPVVSMSGPCATAAFLVASLMRWLGSAPEDLSTRRKLRVKLAELLAGESPDSMPVARHFALARLGDEWYRDRSIDPGAIEKAIEAYRKQVEMAAIVRKHLRDPRSGRLPRHEGYRALARLTAQQGDPGEAMRLCDEAKASGWGGDWDRERERHQRALERRSARELRQDESDRAALH